MRLSICINGFVLVSGLVGTAAPVSARGVFVVGAGAAIPVRASALQEGLTTGVGATCGAGARLGPTELIGRLVYTGFGRDDAGVILRSGLASRPVNVLRMTGGEMTTYDFVADLRFFPAQNGSEITQPFLLGAVGVSHYSYESVEIQYQYAGHTWRENVAAESSTNASFAVGAGVRLAASRRWSIVFEGRYEQVARQGEDLRTAHARVEFNLGL